jgi:hypothetical protein
MAADAVPTPPAETGAWSNLTSVDLDFLQSLSGRIFAGVALLLALAALYRVLPRLLKAIEDVFFTNWRLALLGTTGIVLSLASGWTTWDGMRNFTNEPVLSFMVTFGIQGIMLIIAWLIGESFATGMSQRGGRQDGSLPRVAQAAAGGLTGALLFLALGYLFVRFVLGGFGDGGADRAAAIGARDSILIMTTGLLAAALVVLYSASDVVKPYLQSVRVIAKNAMLWVMFLACMASSVFFSFDSRFNAIFPKDERARAAELRAQNQVGGIVADIGQTIEARRMESAETLFRSQEWLAYEKELDKLANAARGAEKLIEAYYVEQMEERRRGIAEQQERIATAEGSQSGLTLKKAALTEEVARLEAERPALAADLQSKKSDLDGRAKEVDAKRVEAMAEEKGVEGTLKVGRGQIYRQRMGELDKLQDYYKIGEQRVKDAQKRLDETSSRINVIKRELAEIDGSLAKLKGEAETAQQRIASASSADQPAAALKVDPARVLPEFEASRVAFRQKPGADTLTSVHEQCTQLLIAMTSAPTTSQRVSGIDCDPKRAQEAAAALLTLNTGANTFAAACAGGEKLNANKSADDLLGFARRCLADSGLPSADTDALRTKINFIELNRDDKAHNFVVSINAFQDGNRLAYLALAIAIAIDSLIFMSGLFGANAVRSPLSDVPTTKARTAEQLEGIIENALLPDTFDTARVTLSSMRPITNDRGFMAEVRPDRLDPQSASRVLGVLNAGTTIHAVEYDPDEDRYMVRAELFEFLSGVSKKSFHANSHHATLAEMEKTVSVALLPDIPQNIDIVLSYMHPITEKHGFMAEIKLGEVGDETHKRIVRQVLNAGSVHQRVQRTDTDPLHYFIHRDLYQTLARLRARSMYSPAPAWTSRREELRDNVAATVLDAAQPKLEHHGADNGSESGEETPVDSGLEQVAIRNRLLMAMGIAPSAYTDLVRSGALPHAQALGDQLRRLCQHQQIGPHINTEVQDFNAELQSAKDLLRRDTYSAAALDRAADEIEAVLPALLLTRNGRYLDAVIEMITRLENSHGEGHLDTREQQLLRRLKHHEAALSRVGRESDADWQKIAMLIETLADDPATGAFRGETGQRRPN